MGTASRRGARPRRGPVTQGAAMTTGLIEMTEREPQQVAVVHGHVENSEYEDFLAGAFEEVRALLADQHLSPAGPPFARYRATGVGLEVDAGLPVDADVRPAGRGTTTRLPRGAMGVAPPGGGPDPGGFTHQAPPGRWSSPRTGAATTRSASPTRRSRRGWPATTPCRPTSRGRPTRTAGRGRRWSPCRAGGARRSRRRSTSTPEGCLS